MAVWAENWAACMEQWPYKKNADLPKSLKARTVSNCAVVDEGDNLKKALRQIRQLAQVGDEPKEPRQDCEAILGIIAGLDIEESSCPSW